jgi:filamentous hemagglutinin family protein
MFFEQNNHKKGYEHVFVFNLLVFVAMSLYSVVSWSNPSGAEIIHGQVSIDTSTSGVTTITNSPDAIIQWQNFNISHNELTQFIQQNNQSAVLNRIIGENPSEILGQLFSNGKVFLINPNGIVFGTDSTVDTQGLIASSLNLSNRDFLGGNYHFMAGPSTGNIVNEGIIRAGKDGNVILIAPNIENGGIIQSKGGSITLAAGQALTITNLDNPNIRYQVQAPENGVLNIGQLLTEGGTVNLFAGAIKHSGDINADSIEIDERGNINLVVQQNIMLDVGSMISANNSQGDAGKIYIESKTGTTSVQGILNAQSVQTGRGGDINVLGEQVNVLGQASINTSGINGGGSVLIGGDYQGSNPEIHNAKTTYIEKNTTIKADAIKQGDGGKIIAWSDKETLVKGNITAKGGIQGGNGGFIETSGHKLNVEGIHIDASAPKGINGEWLLDPTNVLIQNSGKGSANSSIITTSTIQTALDSGTNISITTTDTTENNSQSGHITVKHAISKTTGSDATLTLRAHDDIKIDADIRSTANKLNLIGS